MSEQPGGETWGEAMARAVQDAAIKLSAWFDEIERATLEAGYTLAEFVALLQRVDELVQSGMAEDEAFSIALAESNRSRITQDER